jgi:ketosteroid isomerase-like protein
MKNAITLCLISIAISGYAQDSSVESVIRTLEQQECKAVLAKDTTTLRKLWAEDFTVNAPSNRVVTAGKNTLDRPVINQADNVSFTRTIEHVMIKGDYAMTMGNEVVVPKSKTATTAPPIKRRYTNVWIKENGEWKLVTRHASVICE